MPARDFALQIPPRSDVRGEAWASPSNYADSETAAALRAAHQVRLTPMGTWAREPNGECA